MEHRLVRTVWLIVCLSAAVSHWGSGVAHCATPGTRDAERAAVYVTRDGDDTQDGTTRETAFASLQRAVNALQPGQTLVMGPGEYFGAVVVDHLGSLDAETVIRAEIPGTVLLRGDIPAPTFQPVPDYRRVFVGDFAAEHEIQMINELDTLRVLPGAPNIAELEYAPGRFYQDRAAGKLYVSSSDTQPADRHCYTLTVVGTHGLYLDTPRRVRVEGLTVTGFNSAVGLPYGQQTLWATYGIFIKNGQHSVVSNCQAYLNGRGIGVSNEYDTTAGDNLITGCRAWGNGGVGLEYDTGGIDLLYARRDQVRDCVAFLNQANGISMRGGVTDHREADASFVYNSLAWGNLEYDFWIKAGENFNFFDHSVACGKTGNTNHLRQCVTGTGAAQGLDSVVLSEEPDLDLDREFADPDNGDFRLQARSRFRRAAPGRADRGAFAYQENIRYLAPAGRDHADGLSVDRAFGTLRRALAGMSAGDTLYLTPGLYREDVTVALHGTRQAPIIVRGRGREPAVIAGKVRVAASSHVTFERVHFTQDVVVQQSDAICFANCVFLGSGTSLTAAHTDGLRVTQSSFTGFAAAALRLTDSTGAHLAGNLYDNRTGPAIQLFTPDAVRYSGYNGYADVQRAWQLGEGTGERAEPQAPRDLAVREIAADFAPAGHSVTLADPVRAAGGGITGNPLGASRRDIPRENLRLLDGPTLHSVSATTANIEWFTSHPAVTTVSWGRSPSVENQTTVNVNRFGSFSLTGLDPGTTYYFRIDALAIPDQVAIVADPVTVDSQLLRFTTKATDDAAKTYYVAPQGRDDNSGLTPDQPLRTIQQAANLVNVGDSVIVAGGTYRETVRIRATGSPGAPIAFRGRPGELVLLDGADALIDFAFVIGRKSHLRFDNFFFANHGARVSHSGAWEPQMGGQFNICESRDIQISRVLSDGRTTGDRLIVAKHVDQLRLSNTVDGNKLEGHYFENCPNLVIEHSVFARPMIAAFILRNAPDEPALIHHNIFTDSLAVKSYRDTLGNPNNVSLLIMDTSTDSVVLKDNLFFLRYFSPRERHLVGQSGYDQLHDVLLFATRFGDPRFQGVADLRAAGQSLTPYDDSRPPFPPDSLWSMDRPFTFRTWLATDPAALSAGIGLDPKEFDADTGLPN